MRNNHSFLRLPIFVLLLALLAFVIFLYYCGNNPWPAKLNPETTLFSPILLSFKTLDPAISYYEHESNILDNIVEMPLGYHYLKRPYQLEPMLLKKIPQMQLFDKEGHPLPGNAPSQLVAKAIFHLELKEGIKYQPHPCFAKEADGSHTYFGKAIKLPRSWRRPADFACQDSREMVAEDFKVALTRLCDPKIASPVFSTFKSFIAGMDECSAAIAAAGSDCNYREIPFSGVEITGKYSFNLIMTRKYPQAIYWMAMHFFAPVPWEALAFYAQDEIKARGLSFNYWPVGTGAYMLDTYEPDSKLILVKNPLHRADPYPCEGEPGDKEKGLLDDAGKNAPFLDTLYFQFESESIPRWIKFTQGYYDLFEISESTAETTDSAMVSSSELSPEMKAKEIKLLNSPRLVSYYYGFNILDPIYGGISPRATKLRRAISIAINTQNYIDIFNTGHGIAAHGILPPGINGGSIDAKHFNSYIFNTPDTTSRRSIEEAKQLMEEAGYKNGMDENGNRLTLSYDHSSAGSANFKPKFLWLQARLQLLGIELIDNGTDLNRFRDKIATGNWQFIRKGWVADYPDPENFLFLFYSKNGHVASKGRGSNYTNYSSPEYDRIFQKLECLANGPERNKLIEEANEILMRDAPCVWESHPVSYILTQPWLLNYKPNEVAMTYLKFRRKANPQNYMRR